MSIESHVEPYVKCFLANVQSVRNKLPELHFLLNSSNFDVLGLTETFLTSCDPNSLVLAGIDDFHIYRCDRSLGRGGGVALFCRRHTSPVLVQLPAVYAVCECIAVDLCGSVSYRVICAYRPPNASAQDSLLLYQLLTWLCDCNLPVVILGDFNLPAVNWSAYTCPSAPIYMEFMSIVHTQGLVQTVLEPTRQHNILDLVLCSDELLVTDVRVEPGFGSSDHSSVVFQLLVNKQRSSNCTEHSQWIRDFRRLDEIAAKQLLSSINWKLVFCTCRSVQQMWDAFKVVLEDVFDQTVPWMKLGRTKKFRYPRFISKLQAKKRRLYKVWKRLGSDCAKQAYRKCCRECAVAILLLQRKREERILTSGSRSRFYSYVNGKRSVRSGVAPLIASDGSTAVTEAQKAAVLGDQFCSVFTYDNGELPALQPKHSDSTFDDFVITRESVRKALCKLELKYGSDPEGIPSAALRILSYELAEPLAAIFKESLATGILPETWKTADIVPIFKKGSSGIPGNYRPVSITSSVCRVFERILAEHLMYYLRKHRLISDEQFGFLKRRSTELQLLLCVDAWTKSLDDDLSTDTVYIDLAKAFDTVCHRKLLNKLEFNFGICGTVLRWISSFLQGRLQRVKVGGSFSKYKSVLSSVPQGSVLGPLLFLLYVNDVGTAIPPEVGLKMFADDIKLFLSYRHAYERRVLQDSLRCLSVWCSDNQLVIQCLKCAVLTLGSSHTDSYEIDSQPVVLVDAMRDLGITVDAALSFRVHISNIVRKAYQSLSLLFKCFYTDNLPALLLAYTSYVRPTLEYASTVWSPALHRRSPLACLSSIDMLEAVQRYFTRRLLKRCKMPEMPYPDRLNLLKLEALELRRLKFSMGMVYKILYGLVDLNAQDMFVFGTSYTRGHSWKLKSPPFKKDVRQNSFAVAVVPIWNSLPESVVSSPSLPCFKMRLSKCNELLMKFCAFDRNM